MDYGPDFQLPILGLIRRRILANYAADPEVVARLLPAPLRPKLANGQAVVGICMIRLEAIRPRHLPAVLGVASENAAHRIAVTFMGSDGRQREGVYVPRRDTSSLFNVVAGGRLFPGEQHRADFDIADDGKTLDITMRARDGHARVELRARHGSAESTRPRWEGIRGGDAHGT